MTTGQRQAATPQAQTAARRSLASRVRILPLTILAVALLLGLKIGALWQGRAELFVTGAGAQQGAQPAQATGQPTQLTPPSQQMAQAPAAQPPAGQAPAGQAPAAAGAAQPGTRSAPSSVQSLADRDPTTFTRAEIELLVNLAQRREQLEQRAREIDLRQSLLAASEKRLDDRLAELKKLEASIKQVVQQYDKQEEQNLQGLVKVYENMKPKDAARIFEKLEPNILLGVVERMKEAKLALVLADMTPQVAQDLTVRLATRKQIPPSLRSSVETQLQPPPAAPAATPAPAAAGAAPPPATAAPARRPGQNG
jgi:flagellar motility protein MotE (MotC chaperone)